MTALIGWLWKKGYTGESWNFVTACSKVSEGCRNCYAERMALRFGWSKLPWTSQNAQANITIHEDRFDKPLHWAKPRMIFVNSMSDLFHDYVPDEVIARAFDIMGRLECQKHIFIILTKRPVRAVKWQKWPINVWMGTSVEDARTTDRIAILRRCNASLKFVSFEPLLGPVGKIDLTGYGWAIVGGESGPDFRPMDHAWARAIRDQCVEQSVPLFFKQSASLQSGAGASLIEADGTRTTWRQWPGDVIRQANTPSNQPLEGPKPQQLSLF